MEICEYVNEKKELYNLLLSFLDNVYDCDEDDFQNLTGFIQIRKIEENRDDFEELIHLISIISKNHHRSPEFINKIEKIILFFEDSIKQTFSNIEIYNFFKRNKRILLFLFENEIINLDKSIINLIFESKTHHFFYETIKPFIDEERKTKIENELTQIDENIFGNFDEKCKNGENHSYICTLIRNDSVEEFISHINKRSIQLSSIIKSSIFETNSFLLKREPTLIEYAAFCGSIQIFQYLRLNRVNLTPSLWLYAIHGRNAELIHLLEENHVEPEDDSYEKYLKESIKCHHNDIAEYIQNTLLSKKIYNDDDKESHLLLLDENDENLFQIENKFDENIDAYCFRYLNYAFIQTSNFENDKYTLFYLCQYNYVKLVDLLLKSDSIDLHKKIIQSALFIEFNNFLFINIISNF